MIGVPRTSSNRPSSLKLMATVLIRPSNSGRTTFIAVSRGVRPAELASHSAEVEVQSTAWRTGTSSRSSRSTTAPVASVWVPSERLATVKLRVLIRTSTRDLPVLVDQELAEDGGDAALLVGVVLEAVAEQRRAAFAPSSSTRRIRASIGARLPAIQWAR